MKKTERLHTGHKAKHKKGRKQHVSNQSKNVRHKHPT